MVSNLHNIEKITIPDNLKDDKYYINNVLSGEMLSSYIYPIIFKDYDELSGLNKFRSIKYYEECTAEIYDLLGDDEKIYFLIGLRDLFFANETLLLDKITNFVDSIHNGIAYQGMNISFYPTKSNKLVRILDNSILNDNPDINCFFASKTNGNFIYVFVDPSELSFHNFDNILHLDRFIGRKQKIVFTPTINGNHYSQYSVSGIDKILSLAKLDLYEPKFDSSSYRGGRRFIFYSKRLASRIYNSIKHIYRDLVKVNPVFRYNLFEPNDSSFKSHYDTPYVNRNEELVSKYSLIIYLTGGFNQEGILGIEDEVIEKVDANTAIIFKQSKEHYGNPYIDSNKIFIRTDLIYDDDPTEEEYSNDVAKMFNIACYSTKNSPFHAELTKYASDLFNKVSMLKYNLLKKTNNIDIDYKIFYKNHTFLTNGNDYWFLDSYNIKDAVVLIINDYFGFIDKGTIIDLDHIDYYSFLKENNDLTKFHFSRYNHNTKSVVNIHNKNIKIIPGWCDHCREHAINPVEKYKGITILGFTGFSFLKQREPLWVKNKELFIDTNDIIIEDYRIRFKYSNYFKGINFASCQSYPDHTSYKKKVPYIYYIKEKGLIHYNIDMFQNGLVKSFRTQVYA
jgi:hypothetical protein